MLYNTFGVSYTHRIACCCIFVYHILLLLLIMVNTHPCAICKKSVKKNQKGLLCTKCNKWVHISCSSVSKNKYNNESEQFINWECSKCIFQYLPFLNEHDIFDNTHNTMDDFDDRRSLIQNDSLKYDVLCDKGLKFLQLNVVSLLRNLDEIRSILYENEIHMFALNETRLDESVGENEINIPCYNIVRKDRNRNGGGVLVYIHESINYTVIDHDSFSTLEVIMIIIRQKHVKPIIFCNWYRPPNSKSEVFNSYEELLSFAGSFDCDFVLMGDINCDIKQKPLSWETKKYNDINNIYCMNQINTHEYTRKTNNSSSLIDHMLTNNPEKVSSFGVLHNGLSDHSMSYLVWKSCNVKSVVKYVTYRKTKGVDLDAFKHDLSQQNWKQIEECESLDEAVDMWEQMFLEVMNKHMPFKTKRVRKKQSPWLNEYIFNLMKERDKMKKKAVRTKNDEDWKAFKKLKNKVTLQSRKAKRKYFIEQIVGIKGRSQSWTVLSSLLSKKDTSSYFQVPLDDCQKMANEFNEHFASVANNMNNDIHVEEQSSGLDNENFVFDATKHDLLELSPVLEIDVLKELMAFPNKRSAGLDGISIETLKKSADAIIKPLTYIINMSIAYKKVPAKCKIAKIIPLYK